MRVAVIPVLPELPRRPGDEGGAGSGAYRGAPKLRRQRAGILEGFQAHFQQHSLLGIHEFGLARRGPEEVRIEAGDVVDEPATEDRRLAGVLRRGWKCAAACQRSGGISPMQPRPSTRLRHRLTGSLACPGERQPTPTTAIASPPSTPLDASLSALMSRSRWNSCWREARDGAIPTGACYSLRISTELADLTGKGVNAALRRDPGRGEPQPAPRWWRTGGPEGRRPIRFARGNSWRRPTSLPPPEPSSPFHAAGSTAIDFGVAQSLSPRGSSFLRATHAMLG